jgi:hypothetical protein
VSKKYDDGGPAFPITEPDSPQPYANGMPWVDYAAIRIAAANVPVWLSDPDVTAEAVVDNAYYLASSLLAEKRRQENADKWGQNKPTIDKTTPDEKNYWKQRAIELDTKLEAILKLPLVKRALQRIVTEASQPEQRDLARVVLKEFG